VIKMRMRFIVRGYGGDEIVTAEELAKEDIDYLLQFFSFDLGREDDLRDLNWVLFVKSQMTKDKGELERIKEIRKEIGEQLRKRADEERRKRGIRSLLAALAERVE